MVNSPLEIYGAVIGAQVYDDFFNILYSFGFVYLPLVFIGLSGIKTLLESPWGYRVAIGRAYWQLGGWIAAMMFAFIPLYPLSVSSVTYTPACSTGAVTSTYGNTGTTYDNILGNQAFPNVNVPPLMALFGEAFSGITNAAIASLPCNTDIPSIQNTINTTQLNPQLAESVKRFRNECFSKAAAMLTNQSPDPTTYQDIENQYGGASDLGWVGSHVYQNLYYGNLYPSTPVPGFPYNAFPYPYQSYNQQKSNMPTPQWGFPSCLQWWNDPTFGIESQIAQAVSAHQVTDPHLGVSPILLQVGGWLQKIESPGNPGSQVTANDAIAYSVLYDRGSQSAFANNAYSNYINDNGLDVGDDVNANPVTKFLVGSAQGLASVTADLGQDFSMVSSSVQRVEIQHEIEIMQAVILTILISVGPLVMLAGNLRMSVIFTYFFLIGSVIMVAFLEQLIHYLEMSLYQSSGMTDSLLSLGTEYPYVYNVFTQLYEYAPFIYLAVMSWCGVAAGSGIQSMIDNSSISNGSGGVGTKALQIGKAAAGAAKAAAAVFI